MIIPYLTLNCLENNIKILKKKWNYTLIIYNNTKYIKISIDNSNLILFNLNSSHLILKNSFLKKFLHLNINIIEQLLFELNKLWFSKITFKGKGFKIKKKSKTKSVKFFFYHSHIKVIVFKNAIFKQKKKNKIIFKTWNKKNLIFSEKKVIDVRPLNVFTKRGLRNSRLIIKKKEGKKSNY